MFTITLTIKLLAALTCFTAMYLTTEAAGTCRATKTCLPGLPGKDGRDRKPGRDGNNGLPGPPGTLNDTEKQQLKDDILNELRDELSMLQGCCNSQPTELNHNVNIMLLPVKNYTSAIQLPLQDTTTLQLHREWKECTVK